MTKVKNNLQYDVIVLKVGGGGQLVVKPGDVVDVPDAIVQDLMLQGFELYTANSKREVKNG